MGNPLLDPLKEQNILETVSIALPTLGRFYEDGVLVPDTDPADIEIYPVGIMAELHARDPFLLAAGKGMAALIMQICPSVRKPEKMAEVDIEAILLASRIVSHGPEMRFKHKCENPGGKGDKPACTHENEIEVNLQKYIMNYEPMEFSDAFVVDIHEFDQRVFIRPIEYGVAMDVLKKSIVNFKDFTKFENMRLDSFLDDEESIEEYTKLLTKTAITNIEGILDGIFYIEYKGASVFDKNQIKEWLVKIPRKITARIVDKQVELGVTLREKTAVSYKCSECGYVNNTHVELDIQKLFFSEPEASKVRMKPSSSSKKSKKPKTTPSRTLQR